VSSLRSLIVWFVAGSALICAAVAGAAQDQAPPPANEDCAACHDDPGAQRPDGTGIGVDTGSFAASIHGPMACVDCHADLASLDDYPHGESLESVNCATCHDDVGGTYHDSIHARAREEAGLAMAPSCSHCHGTHDIRGMLDVSSRVSRPSVAATCGTCHVGILERYDQSIHAAALEAADPRAPVCNDCHTAHAIQRTDTDVWRLSVTRECGTCHLDVVESFNLTFHGKVNQLGFSRVAACADCHGAHDIRPQSDPASMISSARLVETCSTCHPGANAEFVKYDPHPNPRDYERSPVLWWANVFYWTLIPACFAFFALHSALWFNRSWRERRTGRRA